MASRLKSDDSGFTLIELIVSGLLTVVVLSILTGLFMSLNSTATRVRSVTAATTTGQSVFSAIDRAVRNSSAVEAKAIGEDAVLRVRTMGSVANAPAWKCSVWYFSKADKTIRYKSSGASVAVPTAESQKSWTVVADGVLRNGSAAVFFAPAYVPAPPQSPSPAPSSTPAPLQTLAVSFQLVAGKSAPVLIDGSVTTRLFTDSYGGATSCF